MPSVTANLPAEGADPAVDHPAHYNMHPSGVECIELIRGLEFCIGNSIKYVWRAGLKTENPYQDLDKALWYLLQFRELRRRDNTLKTPSLDYRWRLVVAAEPDPEYRKLWLEYLGRDWGTVERDLRALLANCRDLPSAPA